jgi:hypothetical protein
MGKLLIFIFILPFFTFGQTAVFPTKTEQTKIYSQAIADFIISATKKDKIKFDTLFFGKHKNGQPGDFPDIELPNTIEKTQIRLVTPTIGIKKQKESNSHVYINLIGWVNKYRAEFIFVVFSNGFEHRYDCHINYNYNDKLKVFELENIEFKGPPFDK